MKAASIWSSILVKTAADATGPFVDGVADASGVVLGFNGIEEAGLEFTSFIIRLLPEPSHIALDKVILNVLTDRERHARVSGIRLRERQHGLTRADMRGGKAARGDGPAIRFAHRPWQGAIDHRAHRVPPHVPDPHVATRGQRFLDIRL